MSAPADQKCANHEYCKNIVWADKDGAPSAVFCEPCAKLIDGILHKSPLPTECPICYSEKPEYWAFPGCPIGHALCADCLDVLLLGEAYVCGTLCTYAAPAAAYTPNKPAAQPDVPRSQCGGNLMIFPDQEAVVIRPNCPMCPFNSVVHSK